MKHHYFKKIRVLVLGFFLFSGATLIAQNFELQLLHYADVDGNEESALDAVDEFSALVEFFKTNPTYVDNTLIVTSGDLIIPGPRYFAAENSAVRGLTGSNEPGHLDIAFANAFGVHASTFGNHEFDQGPGELFDSAFASESSNNVTFPGSNFPWLSANMDFSSDDDFAPIIGTDGSDITNLNSQVAKYAVVTIDGETIGIVGAAAPSFPNITTLESVTVSPAPNESINDLAAEIQPSVDALTNSGVNKIILLAHMQSISIEKQLAELLDGVDVIVAGGSNTRMGDNNDTLFSNSFVTDNAFDESYPFQTTDVSGDPVLVVNVDGDYKYLGRLVVEFDNNGVIDLSALDDTINGAYPATETLVTSLSATPNADVVTLRDAVQGVISAQFSNVVGFTSVYLEGRRSQVRTQETNLGNLTADANLWYANLLNPDADADVDVSLKNGGGIRSGIGSAVLPGGSNDPDDTVFSPPANNEVSEGNLRATLRFDNGLVRLTLTPEELIMVVEHGLALVAPGEASGRFPQVGGMSFSYDPERPAGNRLLDLTVDKGDTDPSNDVLVLDNGVNVAPGGITFNLVTLNFLANGGDGYPFDELAAPNRLNYYAGEGFGDPQDFPDGELANDPGNNTTFSDTGGEQDALAEFMFAFHPDNASAFNVAETPADQDSRIVVENLPVVSFDSDNTSVSEDGSSVTVTVTISSAPDSELTADVVLLQGGTAVEGPDFTFSSPQTLTFPAGVSDAQTIDIPIIDNSDDGEDIFFTLALDNVANENLGESAIFSVYILDDDTEVPAGNSSVLDMNYLTSYTVDPDGTAEITAYDPDNQRLYVTNSSSIEVLDFSDPENITSLNTIALPAAGDEVQSVAVYNGILAAAVAPDNKQLDGSVIFYEFDNTGQITTEVAVTVGALPDMLTYTPDGTKVVVANEGEPNDDYTIDPEGSISIIDVTGGISDIDQSDVTTAGFTAFNGQEALLRIQDIRIFGPGASVAQDLEPEYVAVSDDSNTAYVSLQENNAYAIVDLVNAVVTDIKPFGLKNHSSGENSFDASNRTDFIFNASWPVRGMYMPDAIDYYSVNGIGFIVTANEGDARDYDGFSEELRLGDDEYVLDPTIFPNASILELESNLGRIKVTSASGNTDNDSEFEEIHVYGGRSFSIYQAVNANQVYDSGNDFEVITAADPTYGPIFNASNSNNEFKNRSDDKGPEPEGVIVEEIEGSYYAFILLERVGGVMVYDVTTPNSPVFLQYLNSRDATPDADESGDLGPEGIVFVDAADSPTGKALLVVSNEVSATLSIYSLDNILAPPVIPNLNFEDTVGSVSEDGGTLTVTVTPEEAPSSEATVDLVLLNGGSAVAGPNFTFSSPQTLTFPAGSSDAQTFEIPIIDNNDDGEDIFFTLSLENAVNAVVGDDNIFSAYILDDDTEVPAGNSSVLNMNYLTSYTVDPSGTAEITAYDPDNQRLFVTNSSSIEVLDFSDPENITSLNSIALPAGTDGVQSVAVSNGLLAAAVAADPKTNPGSVIFYELDVNGQVTTEVSVTVGALPDMLTYTPDGTKVVVANEGEPNDDYTIDPEGSISIIDVTGGIAGIDQSDVSTADFSAYIGQEAILRIQDVRIYGPGANAAQDLEPEYVAVSDDNNTAYVSLQENNAYAIVDLTTSTVTNVISFGLKNHSLAQNSLDTSDETDFVFNASWPIFGMYMPDAIAYYSVNGIGYVVTANEGDAREYDTYEEERKLDDGDYNLDPTIFPNASILELETNLGDINLTNASGNTDNDPEFEEIHVFGGRSFSIFQAANANLIYDSGNDFEVITAADPTYGGIFNASNSNNNFKNRSDNKGPEPEGVIVEEIEGSFYAFVLLERIGGVMVYDVTIPSSPVFLQYLNSRDATPGGDESGDLGPEGVVFVSAENSPTGVALLVISNEVSATLSIFSLDNVLGVDEQVINNNDAFRMYPNPVTDEVFFNKVDDYQLFDMSGRLVRSVKQVQSLKVSDLQGGMYIITNSAKQSKKLIIE